MSNNKSSLGNISHKSEKIKWKNKFCSTRVNPVEKWDKFGKINMDILLKYPINFREYN